MDSPFPAAARPHLDLISDTFDTETERLASTGVRGSGTCGLASPAGHKSRWTTVADVEDNEFDLIAR